MQKTVLGSGELLVNGSRLTARPRVQAALIVYGALYMVSFLWSVRGIIHRHNWAVLVIGLVMMLFYLLVLLMPITLTITIDGASGTIKRGGRSTRPLTDLKGIIVQRSGNAITLYCWLTTGKEMLLSANAVKQSAEALRYASEIAEFAGVPVKYVDTPNKAIGAG